MMRTFGVQTLTGTAQPLFGDKLTAAMAIPPQGIDAIATVANTAIYQQGDRFIVDPMQTNRDTFLVTNIINSTTMQVSSQGAPQHAHAANALIALADSCAEVIAQLLDGTAANAVLGADNTVTATPGGNAVYVLYKTAAGTPTVPFRMTNSVAFNEVRTDDLWIIGTAADKFIASAVVV